VFVRAVDGRECACDQERHLDSAAQKTQTKEMRCPISIPPG
jgi:hypothetical protein